MLKKTILTFIGLIALSGHTSVQAINWSGACFKIYSAVVTGGSNSYFYNYLLKKQSPSKNTTGQSAQTTPVAQEEDWVLVEHPQSAERPEDRASVETEINHSFNNRNVIKRVDFSPVHSSPVAFNTIQPIEEDDIFYTPPQSPTDFLHAPKAPFAVKKQKVAVHTPKQTFRGSVAGHKTFVNRKNNPKENFLTSATIIQ